MARLRDWLARSFRAAAWVLAVGAAGWAAAADPPKPAGAPAGMPAEAAPDPTGRLALARRLEPMLRNPSHTGLMLWEVMPRLPAAKAGLQVGDIVTHYDGQEVQTVSQLQKLARDAALANRRNLLVVAQRGAERIEGEFDAAPLGVRLVAVQKGASRVLWRPGTPHPYEPKAIRRLAAARPDRWDLLTYGKEGKVVGWSRTLLAERGDALLMRVQSQTRGEQNEQKRDVIAVFGADRPNLPLRAYRMAVNGRILMDLKASNGVLAGDRQGLRDGAPLPPDLVAGDLAGLVAAAMPRQQAACLRCSYLEPGQLHAAPFADLFCLGQETVTVGKERLSCHRFDLTVFGRTEAHFWIDGSGDLAMTQLGSGFFVVRSTPTAVQLEFPNALREFPSIEQLPAAELAPPVAN